MGRGALSLGGCDARGAPASSVPPFPPHVPPPSLVSACPGSSKSELPRHENFAAYVNVAIRQFRSSANVLVRRCMRQHRDCWLQEALALLGKGQRSSFLGKT